MKFNFKFSAFALIAMLCFSFGCAPTSSAATQAVPSMEKTTMAQKQPLVIVERPTENAHDIASLAAGYAHATPDDAINQKQFAFDPKLILSREISFAPARKIPPLKQIYDSPNGDSKIKPPDLKAYKGASFSNLIRAQPSQNS